MKREKKLKTKLKNLSFAKKSINKQKKCQKIWKKISLKRKLCLKNKSNAFKNEKRIFKIKNLKLFKAK